MVPITNLSGRLGNQMFQLAYLYSQVKEGNLPDIYLQDYTRFSKYENEIKQLFGEGIGYLQEVAIHLRRGKNPTLSTEPAYSDNPFYVDLSKTDYYEKAIAVFPENTVFMVFSDDIEFAKTYFTKERFNRKFLFSEGNDEVVDLNLMASCSSQIIANSSFSYWAGILNQNPAKKVVYPSRWFSDGINRVIFPDSWIKL